MRRSFLKKDIIVLLTMAATLTGCGNLKDGGRRAIEEAMESKQEIEEVVPQKDEKVSGEDLTIQDIKQKYSKTDTAPEETEEIMPLYNVAQDQEFTFTFHFDYYDAEEIYSANNLVSIHTDSQCKEESIVWTYGNMDTDGEVTTVTQAPISAILDNEYNDEHGEDGMWGNAPVYYIAIWYDTEANEPIKLDSPIVVPFTVKHEVQAPEVRGVVESNGCFHLEWKDIEGAEEYRIYQLVDGNQWTGDYNEPVRGAESGFSVSSLLYVGSTTDTKYDDFNGSDNHSLVPYEDHQGSIYNIGQNFGVEGEYYVSAVVNGIESGFADSVETTALSIPYQLEDEDDIMFARYTYPDELPSVLKVRNIDGSLTPRKVFYTRFWREGEAEGSDMPPYYEYQVEGTALSGRVSMELVMDEEITYPEHIGEATPAGNTEPENNINSQPDQDMETIPNGTENNNLYEQQKQNTQQHKENAQNDTVKAVNQEYMYFADTAEEEWIALNMINGETEISLEGFPRLQYAKKLEDVVYKVYYQNPYILGLTRFGYDYKNMLLTVEYAYDKPEMEKMQQEIYEEAVKVLNETIEEGMTDEEKRLAIYQYLEDNCTYDYEALEDAEANNFKKTGTKYEYAFNTYGILVKKKGVCQSYAYTYKLLCSMSGLNCNVMTGYLDGSLPHAWNTVEIDGGWYQTDATNNGKSTGIPYFLYNSDTETASLTGYSEDKLFEADDNLSQYNSTNKEYEYYYANSIYAEDIDGYMNILDSLLDKNGSLCVRYEGEELDPAVFESAVIEVFSRKNMEQELATMKYGMTNDFILLFNEESLQDNN